MTIQMEFLLKLSYTKPEEDTPLFCSNEIQPLVEEMLKSGIKDFNFRTPLGGTLVHICAANRLLNILKFINTFCVTNNINLNLVLGNRKTGKTPISIAAEQGDIALINFFFETVNNDELLLRNGDNLDKLPVHFAACFMDNQLRDELVERLDPSKMLRKRPDFTGMTAQDILDNPPFSFPGTESCPVLRDSFGRTQFMMHVFCSDLKALQDELESYETKKERDDLVNAKDYYDGSALIYACIIGNVEVIKLLLWHADVNQSDNRENYPLHFAVLNAYKVQHENKATIIELLIAKQAGSIYYNAQGLSPIDFAAMIGQVGIQKLLIDNVKSTPKRVPLQKSLPTMTKRFDQLCLSPSKPIPIPFSNPHPIFNGLPFKVLPRIISYRKCVT